MEEINILKTRSFLLMVGVFIVIVIQVFGINLPGIEFLVDPETFAEFLLPAMPGLFALWAYLERIFGKKKVVFGREKSIEDKNFKEGNVNDN